MAALSGINGPGEVRRVEDVAAARPTEKAQRAPKAQSEAGALDPEAARLQALRAFLNDPAIPVDLKALVQALIQERVVRG
jgi:hypothetical protein